MVHHGRQYNDFDVARYSRQWWICSARSAFWIVVVTLMIWVYADLEISEPREFTVTFRLTMDKNTEAQLMGVQEWPVTFSVKGPRRELARFERWLVDNGDVVTVDVSEYAVAGHDVPIRQLLSRAPEVLRLGLEVQAVTPEQVAFRIEALESRMLPVVFDHDNATVEDVAIEPAEIAVIAPTSVWETIDQNNPEPKIMTRQEDLGLSTSFDLQTRTIPLVSSVGEIPITLSQTSADVTFRIIDQEGTKKYDVSVGSMDHDIRETHQLVKRDPDTAWNVTIMVAGNERDLNRLKVEDIQAFVVLTEEDKSAGDRWIKRNVLVRLPEDLDVDWIKQNISVQFKLLPREPAAEPVTP